VELKSLALFNSVGVRSVEERSKGHNTARGGAKECGDALLLTGSIGWRTGREGGNGVR
jgi:hypothetical protein